MSHSKNGDDAVTAGRGFLWIASAKVYFILASALIALGLPRLLGDPALFGQYRVVNSLVSILNMVMIVGTIQAVSKLVSENENRARSVRRTAIRLQLILGGGVSLIVVLGANIIAEHLFKDILLAPYIRIGGFVTFFYAIYAIFVGMLNGMKRFSTQAKVDALFSTLKVGLIVGLVVAGWGVQGAFLGFVVAAGVITVVGGLAASHQLPDAEDQISTRQLVGILTPILLSTLMINMVLQLDVLGIKGIVHAPLLSYLNSGEGIERMQWLLAPIPNMATSPLLSDTHLLAPAFAQEASSRLVGLFGGAKNISLLPYQATFALTFVVFPMVSKATFDDDLERAANTISQALRFAFLVAGLLCVVLAGVSEHLLIILLGSSYGISSTALCILLVATVGLALFVLGITILNSARMERTALVITIVTLVITGTLLYGLLLSSPDLREALLLRAAMSTFVGIGTGFLITQFILGARFKAHIPIASVARTILVGGLLYWLATMWPVASFPMLVVKSISITVAYLLGIGLLGELKDSDIKAVRRILGRSK